MGNQQPKEKNWNTKKAAERKKHVDAKFGKR